METIASSSHLYAAQIKEFGHFLKDYDQKLAQLQLPTPSNGALPSIVRLKFACENEKLSTARMIESNNVGKPSSQSTNSNGGNSSSNVPLHKILSTFGQLCREIDCLEYEIRSLVRSIYERTEPFRATGGDGGTGSDCAPLMWIAQNMDLMATVQCHYERLRDVGVLLLRQIGAFFDEEASYGRGKRTKKNGLDGKSPPSLEVDYLFDYIGRLLRITLELDHILWKTSLKSHWRAFGQKLRQPTKTALPQSKPGYRDLLFVCQAIGFWIGDESTPDVTGAKRVLEALYRVKTKFDPVCAGEAFSDRFMKFLKRKFATLAADLRVAHVAGHGAELTQADGVIGVNILLNFALNLFLPIEQRMLKNLCELNMKFPLIPLEDNFPWLPDEFVQEQGHKLLRDYDASAAPISVSTPVANSSHNYGRARDGQLQALEKSSISAILCLHAASWLVEAHVQLRNRPPGTAQEEGNFTLEKLRLKCALLLEGIRGGPRGHGQDDDILALMEDFETFIGSYGYDLHGQLFIERQLAAPAGGGPAGGGVVNVVKIEHIANSIKRHGPGIISTVHLSDVFYTLSTISPSEWRIYREMRTIVDRKYGVRLVDDQLPRTTAEDRRGPRGHGQDDDILALMEDFETFIGSYGYDLHGQLFIERQLATPAGGGPSGGGVVNVVKIEHIANSIKRHGPGIISTVVNYAFQFLRQKLFTFSHFLYDEQIHSRLAADAKKLSTEGADGAGTASSGASTVSTPSYTYDRALAFNRRIRNLGLSDDGETYIDLFRKLICQIGNAMAFVRLLHSGALHECTGAAEFLSNPSTSDEQPEEPLDAVSHKSAVTVWRQDMAAVRASWRLENEFFRLLLNAFDGFRRRRADQQKDGGESAQVDNFAHLELFYLIIPPLTISYVEAMLKAKETIAKKDRHGTFLPTDDGFVMGLSYLLTLLNQTAAFNSLHWFKEVHTKYAREMAKLNQQSAGTHHLLQQSSTLDGAADEKMLPTVSLTRKRLNAMQHEFELLQYNLSSSKIFFK
ncbi:AGAP003906-PA-like protein [Anopheles sinensis]|uniref:AGAP003906-PA-like protein n=1 Tax=Anopheles sinensis TaxID=74873 RepID=A0A084VBU6_ANOSI|nr:AGAP003906-PA-like protein [Anopheles sinensis]